MSMIPVVQAPSDVRTLQRCVHSINYSEDYQGMTFLGPSTAFTTAAPVFGTNVFPAMAIDRSVWRKLLKDARWFVYAAGFVNTTDANTATLGLAYVKDDTTLVSLGTILQPAAAATTVKFRMGPFDVFGTVGVPAGETIPALALTAQKTAGANGSLTGVSLWMRFIASKQ